MKAKAVKERKALREKVGNVSVPIYETCSKGYQGFTVAWYENGKRCRKFFAELKDARLHAQTVAVKIENQEREVLGLTPEDSRMFASCSQKLRPLGVTLEAAVREYIEARKIIGDHPLSDALRFWRTHHSKSIPDMSFQDVVQKFITAQEKDGVSPAYLAELKRFLLLTAEQFQMNIMDITSVMLDDYLRCMNCSPGSRNTYRRKLVALFNFARRAGYLPSDKSTTADNAAKAKEPGRDVEVYSPDHMGLLLKHATPGLIPFLTLCGFCGLRPAEARRLHWQEINFEAGFIEVKASKAKTVARRLAPLPENAASWLRLCTKKTGKVVELVGLPHALERLGRRVYEALPPEDQEMWKMPRNALRHSFVSYRLAATQNANQTALEAGHDVKILFRHYRELVTKAEAERWFSIFPEHQEAIG